MNVRFSVIFFIAACIGTGVLFFLVQHRWVVVHWSFKPATYENSSESEKTTVEKRKCKIYAFKDDKEVVDEAIILWEPNNNTHNVRQLVATWVTYQQEERILNQSLSLEAVAVSAATQILLLTFNQPIMNRDWSTFKKWQILESLLKTIRGTELPVTTVKFLVGDQVMSDDHIDFSQGIPVAGFQEHR